ncbi:hypothetical protein [Pedobacter sp. AJM]|uniref:hypothetical protein n=1 Tax=Pedobacter sp. AJM TaxID=2003629 RepID=UPI000B4B1E08|nr:hypothetical protein [Pedobacter sp. AJM]OWK69744.1 hypothetical protein CBW18_15485 [Pedobacter sp. AJM]
MFFWRELNIKIICALIGISIGCNTSKPIQIDDISNLKKIDLSSYQKTTIAGINYYLLPFEQDYTINRKPFPNAEIDFYKYKERNRVVILEMQQPKKVIGFSLQLVNDQDAKTIVSSLQSKHNLQFTIDTIHKIDYGYNFEKRKFQNFNITYVNLIQKDNALYDIRQQLKKNLSKTN